MGNLFETTDTFVWGPVTVQPGRTIFWPIGLILAVIREWHRRYRQRAELLTLDNVELQDMRWTYADAEAEGRKPLWKK
jgi:uncharacterized protein YjiS (DUF1127 family)